ncbi:MAG: methionyl-tRNA formyltransferase [Parcubacteria group bacterium]|nr:methionyl-tRNA formyltransferase [Parcubacteria group bacterium]
MKIAFFSGAEFGVPALNALLKQNDEIVVVTKVPKPTGRNQVLQKTIIHEIAEKNNLKIFTPQKLNTEFIDEFRKTNPDLIVVAAYGKIIPQEILDTPKYGALNIHPSLLPRWRGASPIQYTLLNGDMETGVTIMKVDAQMDHGPIIKYKISKIKNQKYITGELSAMLAEIGAWLLIDILPDYIAGKIKPIEQDHEKATYTKLIKKEDGKIDWNKSAEQIERETRAYNPWPLSFTFMPDNKKIAILKSSVLPILEDHPCQLPGSLSHDFRDYAFGEIIPNKNTLLVQCGNGILEILELQPEGKKIQTAKEFLNGHRNITRFIS